MMQETEEEDVELVHGGRRGPSSLGISSDSKLLKRLLLVFTAVVIAVNVLVFGLGVKLSKDYVPPPPQDPHTPPPSNAQWSNFRLPTTVMPHHYSFNISADMERFTFSVRENIRIEIRDSNTSALVLHARDLLVENAYLWSDDGDVIRATNISYNSTNDFVFFQFGNNLTKWLAANQTQFNLTFTCYGKMDDIARGFYRSSYIENGVRKWLAVTDMEPTDARSAFVCFDEPSFKATYQITVAADDANGWHAISNMPEVAKVPRIYPNGSADGYMMHVFAVTPRVSTYLVCYVVSRFEYVEYNLGKVPVRVFAPPLVKDQGRFAAETASKIVDAYGEYFGIPYALPKLDMIALPDFTSGAMENWGLITYRIEALLYNPNVSSLADKQRIATIISHEVAHQWFGNLVTMAWWDNVWLNEGFASFVEYLGVDMALPEWNIWSQFIPMDRSVAMDLDALASSHPLVVPIEKASEITQQFDGISYSKGASVIRMLQDHMDATQADSFRDGIRHYLQEHRYGNARTTELWEALVEATGQTDVTSFMGNWTEQMGFPYVSAELDDDNTTVHVSQSQFLLQGNSSGRVWQIPLTIRQPDQYKNFMFDQMHSELFVDDDWVIMNENGAGFYRVLYREALQGRLLDQLALNHSVFSDQTRASLLNDAFAFNLAQIVPASYAMSFVSYLKSETDYVPWSTALSAMAGLRPLVDSEIAIYGIYQRFIRTLLKPITVELGWNSNSTDTHSTGLLRPVVMSAAISAEAQDVISTAYSLFTDVKAGKPRLFSPSLNSAVYASAAAREQDEDYYWLREAYMNETSATEKNVLLYSLCRFKTKRLLLSTLQDTLDPTVIKPKDVTNVLTLIARSSAEGRAEAWKFFKDRFEAFKRQFGDAPFVLDTIIRRLTGLFSLKSEKTDVEDFFNRHELGQGSRSIAQALEQIDVNIRWVEANRRPLAAWLSAWASQNPAA